MSMPIPRLTPGSTLTLDFVNKLVDELNWLRKFGVGPGLSLQETTAGRVVSLGVLPKTATSAKEDYSGGEVLVLDKTNPTVTWDKDTDKRPVRYAGSYVRWDTTAHKLVNVYRLQEWDKGGNLKSIGAEQTADIIDAEACG